MVLAAILKFELSTGFKPFAKFHIEQAARFKVDLAKALNPRTKKPLSAFFPTFHLSIRGQGRAGRPARISGGLSALQAQQARACI